MYVKLVEHSKSGKYSGMHRGDAADAVHGNQQSQLSPTMAHTYVKPLHTPTHAYEIYKQMSTHKRALIGTLLQEHTPTQVD